MTSLPLAPKTDDPSARRELHGWCLLALTSLAVAGLFAILVAVARIPGIENLFHLPADFFYRGLVVHVVFAFVIFFLAVAGALFVPSVATDRINASQWSARLGMAGMTLSWASFPLMLVPAFLESGEASLNNYIPAIIHPMFYLGLGLLAAGVLLAGLRFAYGPGRPKPRTSEEYAIDYALLIFVGAAIMTGFSWYVLREEALSAGYNEELFWSGGHLLQFGNTTLLAVTWILLTARVVGRCARRSALLLAAAGWLAVSALGGATYIISTHDVLSAGQRQAFTDLQYLLAPATVLMAVVVLRALLRRGVSFRQPAAFAVLLSVTVFAWGGLLGLFVDGTDTRTPAHYHAMIGGLMAAYMALFYHLFLPRMGRPVPTDKHQNRQQLLFVGGTIVQTAGLFLAGGYGTPRKTAGAEQGLTEIGEQAGMYLNGIGGLLAVIGGIMFIWMVGRRLVKAAPSDAL